MNLKRPHELKSEDTRRRILEATERMLNTYDFEYLTVKNICEEANAAYGSFYYHFQSKENLLHSYTYGLYLKNVESNPVPEWIDPNDFIKKILWYVEVVGFFCEAAGQDLIGYLMTNCPAEMLQDVLRPQMEPILHEAEIRGDIDLRRNKDGRLAVDLLMKDMEILVRGIQMWWSRFAARDTEPLHETLEHMCFNLLFSFSSEQYQQNGNPHFLIYEHAKFPGAIVIEGVPSVKRDNGTQPESEKHNMP